MRLLKVTDAGSDLARQVERIYLQSFPPRERRPHDSLVQRYSVSSPDCRGLLLAGVDGDTVLGFAALTTFFGTRIIHLSLMAVRSGFRGRGYGHTLFRRSFATARQSLEEAGLGPCLGMVWEVERLSAARTDGERKTCNERIAFYTRLGGRLVADFTVPPLGPGLPPIPTTIMFLAADPAADTPVGAIVETVCGGAYGLSSEDPGYRSTLAEASAASSGA